MATDRHERLRALCDRARAARQTIRDTPEQPSHDQINTYLTDGLGPTLAIYIESLTDDEQEPLSPAARRTVETAVMEWLSVYALCYGTEMRPTVSAHTAATALIETGSLRDTAQLLTHVPERTRGALSTNG